MQALRDTDAELGLAFDGDGDRLGIVTKDGQNIFPDRQMMLFAQDVLSRVPGGTICSTSNARSAWRPPSARPAASR
jgi:phosphomannomutase